MKPRLPKLVWADDARLRIGNVRFRLSFDTGELKSGSREPGTFLLGKPRHMVERAIEIASGKRIRNIFEMGILRGGSVVLYDLIFSPETLVAIDHVPDPVQELTDYIDHYGKSKIVKPCYGVSQSNRSAMESLLSAEFPDRDIDLIIDDASHMYAHTREAFNICFPYLSPGGLYVIEDWAWAHWAGDYWQGKTSNLSGEPALSNLLIELFMLSASRPDMIENLFVDHNMVMVRKGHVRMPPDKFDIADHYLLRGKRFETWL